MAKKTKQPHVTTARRVSSGACRGKIEVEIPLDTATLQQLEYSLSVVREAEKLAAKIAKDTGLGDPTLDDWCMWSYRFKKDRVFVTIDSGMCG